MNTYDLLSNILTPFYMVITFAWIVLVISERRSIIFESVAKILIPILIIGFCLLYIMESQTIDLVGLLLCVYILFAATDKFMLRNPYTKKPTQGR